MRVLFRPAPAADLAAMAPALPRGDGHPVLVLPCSGRADDYTDALRALLLALGYRAQGWGLGVNRGPTARLMAGAAALLDDLAARHGPVSLVGFSMGGLLARLLAGRAPGAVRQVITAGSPSRQPARSTFLPMGTLLRLWFGPGLDALAKEVGRPLPVPVTSVFTRDDGIVSWECCRDPAAPEGDVEVAGPHVTLSTNPEVARAIAGRLARPPR